MQTITAAACTGPILRASDLHVVFKKPAPAARIESLLLDQGLFLI
jgi:hypothetical protein